MNTQGTSGHSVTVALPKFEVIDIWGDRHGPFHNLIEAYAYANEKWPDQSQDEFGGSAECRLGWDIQTVGAK